jgi:hypothetical protein
MIGIHGLYNIYLESSINKTRLKLMARSIRMIMQYAFFAMTRSDLKLCNKLLSLPLAVHSSSQIFLQ